MKEKKKKKKPEKIIQLRMKITVLTVTKFTKLLIFKLVVPISKNNLKCVRLETIKFSPLPIETQWKL